MVRQIIQNCEDEQIQFLNEIQPFGYLIGIEKSTQKINFVSENIDAIFHKNAKELLNLDLKEVYDFQLDFSEVLNLIEGDFLKENIIINDIRYHLTAYHLNNFIYIEIEQCISLEKRQSYYKTSEQILYSKSIDETWRSLVVGIKETIDYDRVMVYKFLEDGSGIVIEEEANDGLDSYKGLRFPEFDIPKQARNLYLKKKNRIVSDIQGARIPVISNRNIPIDLTYTSVRALSPIHLEYLKNANAYASFSVSIIVNNSLWGLVTCQNLKAKHIPYQTRIQCELLTRLARISYVNFDTLEKLQYQGNFNEIAVKLKENLLVEENLINSIKKELKQILRLTEADGMAFVNFDNIITEGQTPTKEEILRIKRWASDNNKNDLYCSNSFRKELGEELNLTILSTGIMFSVLDQTNNNFIIWFKKEETLPAIWAGEPQKIKKQRVTTDGTKITYYSPRTSFDFWKEEVNEKSFIWKESEIYVAKEVIKLIIETIHVQSFKIHSLYEQLKEINEELDAFSYTVSHDLRAPLTVMKLNCQLLQKKLSSENIHSAHLKNVIDEIDRTNGMMEDILVLSKAKKSDIILSEIDTEPIIKKIVSDTKIYYNTHKTTITINELDNILAEKTMMYEVFLNIIGNAIKYSSLEDKPQVSISCKAEDNYVIYSIKDNGIGIKKQDYDKMFKLFSRMSNTSGIKGNGIGLTIAQTMMKRMDGDITFFSKEGEGTTFYLKFKKPQ